MELYEVLSPESPGTNMKNNFKRLIKEQNGQDLVEYALLVAIVAVGSIAALTAFQTAISTAWAAISAMLSD